MFNNCHCNIFFFLITTTTKKHKYVFWWLSSALPSLRNCFSASEWNLSWILSVQQWKLNSLWLAWVPSLRIHPCSAELFQVGVQDPKQTLWQPPPNSKYRHYSLLWTSYQMGPEYSPIMTSNYYIPTWAPEPEHFWRKHSSHCVLWCHWE